MTAAVRGVCLMRVDVRNTKKCENYWLRRLFVEYDTRTTVPVVRCTRIRSNRIMCV